jgi:hypothetical protein
MKTKKVCKFEVKILPDNFRDPEKKFKGSELFPIKYANVFLLAKKKSGKTLLLANILQRLVHKNMIVIIIASKHNLDSNYKYIKAWLEKKKIPVYAHTALIEDDENILETYLDELDNQNEMYDSDVEYVFILDDMSKELRNKQISRLLKSNRHAKAWVFLLSQFLTDMNNDARKQLNYILLFGGLPEEKLKTIHEELDLAMDFDKFYCLYKEATSVKYNFLYVDIDNERFRINMDQEIIIAEN